VPLPPSGMVRSHGTGGARTKGTRGPPTDHVFEELHAQAVVKPTLGCGILVATTRGFPWLLVRCGTHRRTTGQEKDRTARTQCGRRWVVVLRVPYSARVSTRGRLCNPRPHSCQFGHPPMPRGSDLFCRMGPRHDTRKDVSDRDEDDPEASAAAEGPGMVVHPGNLQRIHHGTTFAGWFVLGFALRIYLKCFFIVLVMS